MADGLIVAIDQGTSSTKVLVLDSDGSVVARSVRSLSQSHPNPGWVEQDADELFASVVAAVGEAIAGLESRVITIGLSSQRESAVIWDRATGRAVGPVLGWQDRRTSVAAEALITDGHDALVRERTGLPIDPMFSALKFGWLLDSIDPDRSLSDSGGLAVGTVDSWLLFCLTGEHRIEAGNASRTQLLNLDSVDWDDSLLEMFRVSRTVLPRIVASNAPSAPVTTIAGLPDGVRITAVMGDSHAALYGHGARTPGDVKVTYGTGSSVMGLLPTSARVRGGLVRTIAWNTGTPAYAFEGNILSTGATLVWLAGLLGTTVERVSELAESSENSGGVTLVPAFAGLGAPWWDDRAEAILTGLQLGTTTAQIARAAVESIPHQIEDVLAAADETVGKMPRILADGGPSSNRWLMQLQADLSQREVSCSSVAELSAVGVAHLAGETAGLWSASDVRGFAATSETITPRLDHAEAVARRGAWLAAVTRARTAPPSTPPLQRSTT